MDFENYQVSGENPNVLAFSFTPKRLLTIKIGRKSIFHPRETHIIVQLDITVLYIISLRF
jgi:hypothetical protein